LKGYQFYRPNAKSDSQRQQAELPPIMSDLI
jgi:hypothetical protein